VTSDPVLAISVPYIHTLFKNLRKCEKTVKLSQNVLTNACILAAGRQTATVVAPEQREFGQTKSAVAEGPNKVAESGTGAALLLVRHFG
jgi:hypothetical protein